MKNILKIIGFSAVAIFLVGNAYALDTSGLCPLIVKLKEVFNILRILAFVGAAFILASWAWGWITGGKGIDIAKEDKNKLIAMVIGFVLLFSVGLILSFLMSGNLVDCRAELIEF